MKQPLLGVSATALVIAISLAYLALFDLPTFLGWVAFSMLCLIPMQIVVAVTWGANPSFTSGLSQPAKGAALLLMNIVAAAIIAPLALFATTQSLATPGPIPSQFAVVVVPTAFFLAIAFGGWPFTALTRNAIVAGLLVLAAAYIGTYALFPYDSGQALVWYVTALAGMFVLLHFDLWPLSLARGLMKQPILGIAWSAIAFAIAAAVMTIAGGSFGRDPMYILTRITAPFIFGTIVVLNMLQNSLFAGLAQPTKGLANAAAAMIIGAALAQIFGALAPVLVGMPLASGAPGFEYELWLVNALLSVTFPFLIFAAAYFEFWPIASRAARKPTGETART